ncbi:hypothetical protein M885DRAFT_54521 [Pelagophyceae sp. CCMP2097]|nr:hypothetical protein M885DRAFT_54521 [Pelagophyceae sp. CCMP2097]
MCDYSTISTRTGVPSAGAPTRCGRGRFRSITHVTLYLVGARPVCGTSRSSRRPVERRGAQRSSPRLRPGLRRSAPRATSGGFSPNSEPGGARTSEKGAAANSSSFSPDGASAPRSSTSLKSPAATLFRRAHVFARSVVGSRSALKHSRFSGFIWLNGTLTMVAAPAPPAPAPLATAAPSTVPTAAVISSEVFKAALPSPPTAAPVAKGGRVRRHGRLEQRRVRHEVFQCAHLPDALDDLFHHGLVNGLVNGHIAPHHAAEVRALETALYTAPLEGPSSRASKGPSSRDPLGWPFHGPSLGTDASSALPPTLSLGKGSLHCIQSRPGAAGLSRCCDARCAPRPTTLLMIGL